MGEHNIKIKTVYRIFSVSTIQGLVGGQSIKGLAPFSNSGEFASEREAYAWIEARRVALSRELNDLIILPTYRAGAE